MVMGERANCQGFAFKATDEWFITPVEDLDGDAPFDATIKA
ncbi:hypothetical protein KSD_08490 [Ktedonobacter sp. SOSP1-85]|nr:hypothetical protein KSD_08490 [Ktedonobacter sp. SOSP1-85]